MGWFNNSKDERSTDQKLEAIIAPGSGATEGERSNASHLLFKRRQKSIATSGDHSARYDAGDPACVSGTCGHTRSDGTKPTNDTRRGRSWLVQPGLVTKPHRYEAYGGSDALGCRNCGKSKDNKSANHQKAL